MAAHGRPLLRMCLLLMGIERPSAQRGRGRLRRAQELTMARNAAGWKTKISCKRLNKDRLDGYGSAVERQMADCRL